MILANVSTQIPGYWNTIDEAPANPRQFGTIIANRTAANIVNDDIKNVGWELDTDIQSLIEIIESEKAEYNSIGSDWYYEDPEDIG